MILRMLFLGAALVVSLPAAAQHGGHGPHGGRGAGHAQPYAGQQHRDIKALSAEEVEQYLAGAGLGYAKAAELNRYPGPLHALELASELKLTPDQRARIEALMAEHKTEARRLGARVVERERELERLFATGRATEAELARAVRAAAEAQGDYRLSHLETHRRMRPILSEEQVAHYVRLRGYDSASPRGGHGRH